MIDLGRVASGLNGAVPGLGVEPVPALLSKASVWLCERFQPKK